jgi:hypothetical protein
MNGSLSSDVVPSRGVPWRSHHCRSALLVLFHTAFDAAINGFARRRRARNDAQSANCISPRVIRPAPLPTDVLLFAQMHLRVMPARPRWQPVKVPKGPMPAHALRGRTAVCVWLATLCTPRQAPAGRQEIAAPSAPASPLIRCPDSGVQALRLDLAFAHRAPLRVHQPPNIGAEKRPRCNLQALGLAIRRWLWGALLGASPASASCLPLPQPEALLRPLEHAGTGLLPNLPHPHPSPAPSQG